MSVSSEYSLNGIYSKEDFIITFSASPRTALAPWRSARTSRSKMRREIFSVGKDYANKKAETRDSVSIFIPSTLSCVIVSHNAVSHIVFSSFRESSYFRGEAVRNVFKNKFAHKIRELLEIKLKLSHPQVVLFCRRQQSCGFALQLRHLWSYVLEKYAAIRLSIPCQNKCI